MALNAYADCYCSKFHFTDCHCAECILCWLSVTVKSIMLSVITVNGFYDECRNEVSYAECPYT